MVINAKVIKTKKQIKIKKIKNILKSYKSEKNIYIDILSNAPFILSYNYFLSMYFFILVLRWFFWVLENVLWMLRKQLSSFNALSSLCLSADVRLGLHRRSPMLSDSLCPQ